MCVCVCVYLEGCSLRQLSWHRKLRNMSCSIWRKRKLDVSLRGGPEKILKVRDRQSHLPTSLSGRGPYLSIRRPNGSVAALSRKEPMVKPRLSISSCSTQLGQAPLDSATTDWFVSSVSLTATSQRRGGKKPPTAAREQIQHIIHVFLQKKVFLQISLKC